MVFISKFGDLQVYKTQINIEALKRILIEKNILTLEEFDNILFIIEKEAEKEEQERQLKKRNLIKKIQKMTPVPIIKF